VTLDSSLSVPVIASAVGIFISCITLYYNRRQNRLKALVEVFKLLNDEKHRAARQVVYQFHEEGKASVQDHPLPRFPNETQETVFIRECQAIVRNDFNQIGSLIENSKFVPTKEFIDTYWYIVCRCWIALKTGIDKERLKRGNFYMKDFENLYGESNKLRGEKRPEVKLESMFIIMEHQTHTEM
jgi:hypothetical protein